MRRKVIAVSIDTSEGFEHGSPDVLFRPNTNLTSQASSYDVTSDGEWFLVNVYGSDEVAQPVTVILNWTNGLAD